MPGFQTSRRVYNIHLSFIRLLHGKLTSPTYRQWMTVLLTLHGNDDEPDPAPVKSEINALHGWLHLGSLLPRTSPSAN